MSSRPDVEDIGLERVLKMDRIISLILHLVVFWKDVQLDISMFDIFLRVVEPEGIIWTELYTLPWICTQASSDRRVGSITSKNKVSRDPQLHRLMSRRTWLRNFGTTDAGIIVSLKQSTLTIRR